MGNKKGEDIFEGANCNYTNREARNVHHYFSVLTFHFMSTNKIYCFSSMNVLLSYLSLKGMSFIHNAA